jgi:riboflavin synthase
MFTGIIEELGRVERVSRRAQGGVISIAAQRTLEGTKCGDSLAVNGVCLTATSLESGRFTADMSEETLTQSTLGALRPGAAVNLERALALGHRLGGHIVQGHIDATGRFQSRRPSGDSVVMRFEFPLRVARYIALKGSVAIDGVSLTVADLGPNWLEVAVIPTTLEWTTLPRLSPGDAVNLETDVLAKYLERLLDGREARNPYDAAAKGAGLTAEHLQRLGY